MRALVLFVLLTASVLAAEPGAAGAIAPKPLFRDPVFDGAADPTIVYSRAERKWLMFYTNRRANVPGLTAVTWVHGTPIGIAGTTNSVVVHRIGGEEPEKH